MPKLLNRVDMLRELEKDEPILVNFTKVNGTKRDMKCTLSGKLMPKGTDVQNEDEDKLVVWDLEKSGFRTILLDNVNHVFSPAP